MSSINWEEELLLGEGDDREIRIVLLGNPGTGKSSSGNTILGRRVFRSLLSPTAVTSTCERQRGRVFGQELVVIDTPGTLGSTGRDAARCLELAAPGPHVFLLVVEPRRFTEDDDRMARLLTRAYGGEVLDFTIVLFTHGDQLATQSVSIQTFIGQSAALRSLVRQCGGRRHVFNNRTGDRAQVQSLLRKIQRMMESNGGDFFTAVMPGREEEDEEEQSYLNLARPASSARRVRPDAYVRPTIHINNFHVNIEAQRNDDPVRSFINTSAMGAAGSVLGIAGGPVGVAVGALCGSMIGGLLGSPRREQQPRRQLIDPTSLPLEFFR